MFWLLCEAVCGFDMAQMYSITTAQVKDNVKVLWRTVV